MDTNFVGRFLSDANQVNHGCHGYRHPENSAWDSGLCSKTTDIADRSELWWQAYRLRKGQRTGGWHNRLYNNTDVIRAMRGKHSL